MRFSAFSPLGMLRLSGRESHAQRIYTSIVAGLASQFDTSPGSRYEAFAYAEAMRLARIQYAAEHAAAQAHPGDADVMLPVLERDRGIAPGPVASVNSRRAELATRFRTARVPTRYEVETALSEMLGDDFLAFVPTPIGSAALFPTSIETSPCNLVSASNVRRYIRLLGPVSLLAGNVTVAYEPINTTGRSDDADEVEVGETLVVEPEILGITERVTVLAATSETVGGVTTRTLTAFFTKAHSTNCSATTMNFPCQRSTKRHSLVVLTPAAAVDPVLRRQVHSYLHRTMRGSSTWHIVQGAAGTTGTFTIGSSIIGAETISPATYP